MTDKEFKALSRLIDKIFKRWTSTLGFRRWTIHTNIYRDLKEGSPDTSASCDAQWEYQNMWIKFYGPKLVGLSEKQVEEVVLHEMIHGMVNQMRLWSSSKMHHEESVVTALTQAILWAKWDGVQEGKRKKK